MGSPYLSLLLWGLLLPVCYFGVSPCFFVIMGSPSNSVSLWGLPIMVCYCRVSPCQQVPTHLKLHLLLSWGGPGSSGGEFLAAPTLGMARRQPGVCVPLRVSGMQGLQGQGRGDREGQGRKGGMLGSRGWGARLGGWGAGVMGGCQWMECQVNRRIPVDGVSGYQGLGCQGSEGMPGDGMPR